MALTELKVKNATLPDNKKTTKIYDMHSLYLLINKSGKYWQHKYRIDGKEKHLALGIYPETSLAEARVLNTEARQRIKSGYDPIAERKERRKAAAITHKEVLKQALDDTNTFEVVAMRWHALNAVKWSLKYQTTTKRRFELYVFPTIGQVPISKLTKKQLSDVILVSNKNSSTEVAYRIGQMCQSVFVYADDLGLVESIPTIRLKNILPAFTNKKMPAIIDNPQRLGEFLRAVDNYSGTFIVCCALKLQLFLGVRSGEFRLSTWEQFDLEQGQWIIPSANRKLKKHQKADNSNAHLVPLSKQVVAILNDLKSMTGHCSHVFQSRNGGEGVMSENTVNKAIARMGFKGEVVGHGFRSMFSSTMNAQGFNRDAIERQLAHVDKDAIRARYNRTEYLAERTTMMQAWADYLDELRNN